MKYEFFRETHPERKKEGSKLSLAVATFLARHSRPDPRHSAAMRACVIFNPTARGEKAKRFRRHLDEIGKEVALKMTAAPDDARRLSAEAVREGFDTIVAAGGDGTVNEVLNGMGDAEGFKATRLGVLPLGTVNVFAQELGISSKLEAAWETIRKG